MCHIDVNCIRREKDQEEELKTHKSNYYRSLTKILSTSHWGGHLSYQFCSILLFPSIILRLVPQVDATVFIGCTISEGYLTIWKRQLFMCERARIDKKIKYKVRNKGVNPLEHLWVKRSKYTRAHNGIPTFIHTWYRHKSLFYTRSQTWHSWMIHYEIRYASYWKQNGGPHAGSQIVFKGCLNHEY